MRPVSTPAQVSLVTGHGVTLEMTVAGTGARSYACVIDWHIRTLLAAAWLLLFVAGRWLAEQFGYQLALGQVSGWLAFVPAGAVYLLYHPVLEVASQGRTPGKRMAGVRVIAQDGRQASVAMHLLRNVFRLVDSLPALYCVGVLCCLCNRRELRIGDYAAGTVLVYDEYDGRALRRAIGRHTSAARHDPELIKLVADVVARWPLLEPERRQNLARGLLRGRGLETNATPGPELLAELKALLAEAGDG